MKPEWERAEREAEVRHAARSWRDAGATDGLTAAEIERLYPAVWRRPGPLWGILIFFFTSLFAGALLVASSAALRLTAFLLAAGLAAATERLRGSPSTVAVAIAASGAFWSVVCLMVGSGEIASWRGNTAANLVLAAGAAGFALAAVRWGYPALAALAAIFLYLWLGRSPAGRPLWLLFGAAITIAGSRLLDRRTLSPSHRRSAAAVTGVSLLAVYAAVNLYTLDHRVIEGLSRWNMASGEPSRGLIRFASIAGTALIPLAVLAWGIRSRRTFLLDIGIVTAALSLVTIRCYVHIAPLWTILTVSGAGLILAALAVHRWLDRGPGRERGGFTANALFEDQRRQHALGVLGAIPLAPQAAATLPEQGKFSGGGGGFGGGGASSTF